jgi:hypothetical protein
LLLRFPRFCVNVVRRHVPAAVAQHPLNDHRVCPLLSKPRWQLLGQLAGSCLAIRGEECLRLMCKRLVKLEQRAVSGVRIRNLILRLSGGPATTLGARPNITALCTTVRIQRN